MSLIFDDKTRKLNIKKFFEGKVKPSILSNSKTHNKSLSTEQKKIHAHNLNFIQQYSTSWFEEQRAAAEHKSMNMVKPLIHSLSILQSTKKDQTQKHMNTSVKKSKIDLHCYEILDFDTLECMHKIPNKNKK